MEQEDSFRQFYSAFIQELMGIRTEGDTNSFRVKYSLDGVSHLDTLPASLYLDENPRTYLPEEPRGWPLLGSDVQDYLKIEIDLYAMLSLVAHASQEELRSMFL